MGFDLRCKKNNNKSLLQGEEPEAGGDTLPRILLVSWLCLDDYRVLELLLPYWLEVYGGEQGP